MNGSTISIAAFIYKNVCGRRGRPGHEFSAVCQFVSARMLGAVSRTAADIDLTPNL